LEGRLVVFFFTSGYIITHVLQAETTIEFLIKRVFRIYPLYIFAVLTEVFLGSMVHGVGLPPLSILIPRLLLLGDFFDTGYSLGGVDWTLRIEIMFYVFMAALKSTGLLKRSDWLPAVFVLCTGVLHMVGPFPVFAGWSNGYFTLYGPFLFIGSVIYLAEHQIARKKYCIASIVLIFLRSCSW
jgi:peptidoglycan/LPS O-acetylase OafA/YrhL